jgi:hypothetical protein
MNLPSIHWNEFPFTGFSAAVGLLCVWFSFLARRPSHMSLRVIETVPWIMLAVPFGWLFFSPFVIAGSGPNEVARLLKREDLALSGQVALSFGFVLVVDALRFRELRRRPYPWFCFAVYLFIAAVLADRALRA